jgi:hypothetical protein
LEEPSVAAGARNYTAFVGASCVAAGSIDEIARALFRLSADTPPVIFDDESGTSVELDLRHGPAAAVEDYLRRTTPEVRDAPPPRQGPGRPRLGVTAREVTLLPQHWEWLAGQPGGASAALRRLVDDARRRNADADRTRQARDATYRVMSALAGDLPEFEAATRALFRGDWDTFDAIVPNWPADVGAYVRRMAADLPRGTID